MHGTSGPKNRHDFNWTSRKNSLELIELFSVNKPTFLQAPDCKSQMQIREATISEDPDAEAKT